MNKNTFLNELMSMNKDDIHKFIMEKDGKWNLLHFPLCHVGHFPHFDRERRAL